MLNVRKMSYKELEQRVIENNCRLRRSKDLKEHRRLCNENYDLMVEMDRRWNLAAKR